MNRVQLQARLEAHLTAEAGIPARAGIRDGAWPDRAPSHACRPGRSAPGNRRHPRWDLIALAALILANESSASRGSRRSSNF